MKVSVCMAAYNGADFISEQVASILSQLSSDDELIVVDDGSIDDTVAVLKSFQDARLKIFIRGENRGIVLTFEYAMRQASGDIIFLSDQDDVWCSNKVAKFLEIFESEPQITLVMSDLVVIDRHGKTVTGPKFQSVRFRPGIVENIVRNQYQGSAMAFRRSILVYCLPFPSDIPMHDVWIGLVNQLIGRATLIPEPLLLYRRHDSNESLATHASLTKMFRWRWVLATKLFQRCLHRIVFQRPRA
jgi:glycosyltransferase involved in cell wall biosynthesis